MTPQMESHIVTVMVRPFCYRPVGTREWFLGCYIVGCDIRAMMRLGPLEFDMRPEKRPSGISELAWQAELAHRQRETHPASGHG
jgi:hypothetical protein